MTPRLIVHADDFGRSVGLTEAVAEAFERGILTSASIVAGGPEFERAAALTRAHPELDVGVHLAVDEYPPIADPERIPTLLGPDGCFRGRGRALLAIASGRASLAEMRREWESQVQKVVDAGLRPSHLDGHGHCHAAPRAATVAAEVAERFGIPAIRIPFEPLLHLGNLRHFSARRYVQKLLVCAASAHARTCWKRRLRSPDRFAGFTEGGRLDAACVGRIAASLGPGVCELMTHPGLANDDAPFGLDYDWRGDFEAVTAFDRTEFEDRFGVRLVSYRDAWSETA